MPENPRESKGPNGGTRGNENRTPDYTPHIFLHRDCHGCGPHPLLAEKLADDTAIIHQTAKR
jgi:hypothetical protein